MLVQINFCESVYQLLGQMAERTGRSMGEVLRDAIALAYWAESVKQDGGHILVEREGQLREVLW